MHKTCPRGNDDRRDDFKFASPRFLGSLHKGFVWRFRLKFLEDFLRNQRVQIFEIVFVTGSSGAEDATL